MGVRRGKKTDSQFMSWKEFKENFRKTFQKKSREYLKKEFLKESKVGRNLWRNPGKNFQIDPMRNSWNLNKIFEKFPKEFWKNSGRNS